MTIIVTGVCSLGAYIWLSHIVRKVDKMSHQNEAFWKQKLNVGETVE